MVIFNHKSKNYATGASKPTPNIPLPIPNIPKSILHKIQQVPGFRHTPFFPTLHPKQKAMHQISYPSILYFGTPVILVSTTNADDSHNIAPISSVFWLGWRCMIGISAFSKTTENLLRPENASSTSPPSTKPAPSTGSRSPQVRIPFPQANNKKATAMNPTNSPSPASPHSVPTSSNPPAQNNALSTWRVWS